MTLTPESFWPHVAVSGEDVCWPWKRARLHFGHGAVSVSYGHGQDRAHRVAWILTFGAIPKGLCVLHRCDNPPCCNPRHLFLGTKADNVADRHRKGRDASGQRNGRYTQPERTARGTRNGMAKLNPADVATIKSQRESGATLAAIAASFGVGTSQIHRITTGKSWGMAS